MPRRPARRRARARVATSEVVAAKITESLLEATATEPIEAWCEWPAAAVVLGRVPAALDVIDTQRKRLMQAHGRCLGRLVHICDEELFSRAKRRAALHRTMLSRQEACQQRLQKACPPGLVNTLRTELEVNGYAGAFELGRPFAIGQVKAWIEQCEAEIGT